MLNKSFMMVNIAITGKYFKKKRRKKSINQ